MVDDSPRAQMFRYFVDFGILRNLWKIEMEILNFKYGNFFVSSSALYSKT